MISDEMSREYEEKLNFVEYHASFINSEAVMKVRDSREFERSDNFMGDEEFETFVKDGLYKDTDLIDAIRNKDKNTNLDNYNTGKRKDARGTRVPKNLSSVIKLTED